MRRFFPILNWFPTYGRSDFYKDLSGGLTVGIILIPQGMAYAMIAGLPPVYGLYAALIPLLVYAFMGTSRQLAVGPVAMDSLLIAAGLGALAISGIEEYITMAILLTFMMGVIQILLGAFRMGFLMNFLSRPVISGFTSSAALIIAFSQLKHLLGTNVPRSNFFHIRFANNMEHLHETHLLTMLIGLLGIGLIVFLNKWNHKIPAAMAAVFLGILASVVFKLETSGVALVGEISGGLPSFSLPVFNWTSVKSLTPMALALAVIGYMEAMSIAQALEERNQTDTVDPNQELIALGSSNLLGSLFQSYAVTGSISRSAISHKQGVRTPLFGVFSALLVMLTLLFFTPVFHYLPNTVLAAIIMVTVASLVEIRYPLMLWRYQRDEFYLLVFTFLFTLFLGVQQGILLGVLLSVLLMLYRTSKPHFAVLGKIRDSEYYKNVERFGDETELREDLLIVRFDSQLYFGNKNFFRKQLNKYMEEKGPSLKGVILNAEAINYIDSTATAMLVKLIREIQGRGIKFYISGAIGPTRDVIFTSGIIDLIPREHLFIRIKDAVTYFDHPESASDLQARIAYQSKVSPN